MMPIPRPLFAIGLALALAGCAELAAVVPELAGTPRPSPRPSGQRFSQPLASPEAHAFRPRQWLAQGAVQGEGWRSWTLVAVPAPGRPAAYLMGDQGGAIFRAPEGEGWTRVAVPVTVDQPHTAMAFVDVNTGWLATPSKLLGTTDGGATWSIRHDFTDPARPDPTNAEPIAALAFTGPSTGFLLKGGRLHRTKNGGRTWSAEDVLGQPLASTRLAAWGERVWAGGAGVSRLLPGEGWAVPAGSFRLTGADAALAMVSPTEGWAIGQGEGPAGAVPLWRTADGGDTWTPHPLRDAAGEVLTRGLGERTRMAWVDRNHGWISAGASLYLTADGGTSWTLDRTTARVGIGVIDAVAPLGPDAGWVVSNARVFRLAVVP